MHIRTLPPADRPRVVGLYVKSFLRRKSRLKAGEGGGSQPAPAAVDPRRPRSKRSSRKWRTRQEKFEARKRPQRNPLPGTQETRAPLRRNCGGPDRDRGGLRFLAQGKNRRLWWLRTSPARSAACEAKHPRCEKPSKEAAQKPEKTVDVSAEVNRLVADAVKVMDKNPEEAKNLLLKAVRS